LEPPTSAKSVNSRPLSQTHLRLTALTEQQHPPVHYLKTKPLATTRPRSPVLHQRDHKTHWSVAVVACLSLLAAVRLSAVDPSVLLLRNGEGRRGGGGGRRPSSVTTTTYVEESQLKHGPARPDPARSSPVGRGEGSAPACLCCLLVRMALPGLPRPVCVRTIYTSSRCIEQLLCSACPGPAPRSEGAR